MKPSALTLSSLLLALPLAACGPKYNTRVPSELVTKLPYETRIELLEAENDLALAVDRLDEAHNEVLRTRDTLRRAKDRTRAAEAEEDAAKDEPSREVARLAIAEAKARVSYLRARQEVNAGNEDVEQLALRCAVARFELARMAAARKAKVEGSERLTPKDFEQQVTECDAEVARNRAEMKSDLSRSAAAKDAWDEQKRALAQKTFDARASPFVE